MFLSIFCCIYTFKHIFWYVVLIFSTVVHFSTVLVSKQKTWDNFMFGSLEGANGRKRLRTPGIGGGNRTRFGASTNTAASSMSLLSSCASPFSTKVIIALLIGPTTLWRCMNIKFFHSYKNVPAVSSSACILFVATNAKQERLLTVKRRPTLFHSVKLQDCQYLLRKALVFKQSFHHHPRASPACRFMPQLANAISWVRVFSKLRGEHSRSHTPDNTKL